MCGIVAYVGSKECAPLLVEGLRRLEYRGYDSAGLAVHTGKVIQIARAVGKLSQLDRVLEQKPLKGRVGIGHTRWATHGRPNEVNAHPHLAGTVAVVHNGIIENHSQLRRELEGRGAWFASDTDTEIVAHLINEARANASVTLEQAVRSALLHVRGAYAIAVVCANSPNEIVVAKHQSPLVLGFGDGEMLAASDVTALLAHTRDVTFLNDGEMAVLTQDGARITGLTGEPVTRSSQRIDWSPSQAEKGGYKHFMLKEIHEQPRALEDTLRGRIDLSRGDVLDDELGLSADIARSLGRVYFVACGSSYYGAMTGRYWMEELARVPAVVEIGSEVRHRDPVFFPSDLVVAVSQSGETIDTLAAVQAAKAQGAHVLAIANVLGSTIPRASDGALYTHAGPEIGVASTKCFTAQLAVMLLLAVQIGRRRGALSEESARRVLDALVQLPMHMREVLAREDEIRALAKRHVRAKAMLFLGRGTGYPIALEGALKMKELSYLHAEGYAAGEMKHGPIALIDDEMPVVVVCPQNRHYEKTLSNMQEVRAREGHLIAVCTAGDTEVGKLLTVTEGSPPDRIEIPAVEHAVEPLLTVIPLQLLAYSLADLKGTDVDQPRNLAKTVTVE